MREGYWTLLVPQKGDTSKLADGQNNDQPVDGTGHLIFRETRMGRKDMGMGQAAMFEQSMPQI